MSDYLTKKRQLVRSAVLSTKLYPEDRRLIRRAAAEVGASVSTYAADRLTRAARRDLAATSPRWRPGAEGTEE